MSDLIDRQSAIKTIYNMRYKKPNKTQEKYNFLLDLVCEKLFDLPPAQPERKKGEWERIQYSFIGGYRCSCCGCKSIEKYWNFCPNCGAKMDWE